MSVWWFLRNAVPGCLSQEALFLINNNGGSRAWRCRLPLHQRSKASARCPKLRLGLVRLEVLHLNPEAVGPTLSQMRPSTPAPALGIMGSWGDLDQGKWRPAEAPKIGGLVGNRETVTGEGFGVSLPAVGPRLSGATSPRAGEESGHPQG